MVGQGDRINSLVRFAAAFHNLLQHAVEGKASGLLARRELLEGRKPLPDIRGRRNEQEGSVRTPPWIINAFVVGTLERVAPQVEDLGDAECHERLLPDIEAMRALLREHELPVVVAQGNYAAVVAPVEEFMPRRLLGFAFEIWDQVIAVEMNLVGLGAELVALLELCLDVRLANGGQECRYHVFVRANPVEDAARLNDARPTDNARHAVAA